MATNEYAVQKRREYMRDYLRAYRKKYPERIKATQERYWEKKAKEGLENGNERSSEAD